ncbi:glutathione S-transferase family protein [Aerophototrophica crusticola]|uniref:Glutathione S-transferase family protein n=1 Tax=Aerophototrophica crusticola TaxID=1709002 RepID=A0A858R2U7_9PROT|nr:glutathione S-transferase family protein [Rhodospirillaceae bacterium B3]
MILIGQYDSPFVRRVAVTLRLYGMPYEHRPWSVFSDAAELARYNPLTRVPTLVLDDGEVLVESGAILDHLDEVAGPHRALIAQDGKDRRRALKLCALATGLADKAVSLVYERVLHQQKSDVWVARCTGQILAVLDALEDDRKAQPGAWWMGDRIGHPDIALACALRFLGEAHPGVFTRDRWPALAAHAEACEALAEFQAVVQPFSVNA